MMMVDGGEDDDDAVGGEDDAGDDDNDHDDRHLSNKMTHQLAHKNKINICIVRIAWYQGL